MKPFRFSNGVTIPAGEVLASPARSVHMDTSIYEDPEFDGFRFSKMREQEGNGAKHQAVITSTGFLTFGHGAHPWYCCIYSHRLMKVLVDITRLISSS